MSQDLIEQIYEAAFVPEQWPGVLDNLGAFSGSASGALLVFDAENPPRWKATENVQQSLHEFTATDAWRRSLRAPHRLAPPDFNGFRSEADYLTPEQLARDPVRASLARLGLGWQLGTFVPMPSGEVVVFTVERRLVDGPHGPAAVAALDALRPHLARAGLLAARLGLERARTAVATLEAIALPAAVLTGAGRVLVANDLLEAASPALVQFTAGDGLAIVDKAADALWRAALGEAQAGREPVVRSIPVAASGSRAASVVHLLPLGGAARDIFSGAALLVVVTQIGMAEETPDPKLLHGLFDLTPGEARLATALSAGRSLKEAAAETNLRFSTARSYLEQVFRKTGTHQQSQLVALLKSARPLGKGR